MFWNMRLKHDDEEEEWNIGIVVVNDRNGIYISEENTRYLF